MIRIVLRVILAVLAVTLVGAGAETGKKKYEYVQVNRFDVQQGVDFPADALLRMVEEIARQFEQTKGLKQVMRQGETIPEDKPVLRVAGTVTGFKKGSRAARALVGFGAGATVVTAQLRLYDAATSELLLDRKVDGKVILGGLVASESAGATNGVAKEIVKVVRSKFL